AYKDVNNIHIPMKEALNDAQIIETLLVKQLENKQDNPDNSNKEPLKIFASEELNRLKNFILFAEQHISANQNMTINNRFFLNDLEFSNNDNGIYDNNYFFDNNDFPNNDHFSDNNDFLDNDYFSDSNYFSKYKRFFNNYNSSSNDIITN
ncbi:16134_t:CDS:2, partial [Cetraspora pellucida]